MKDTKELKRILFVLISATLMAININTFVSAGGLYPGGATGLTVLIQRSAELFFGVSVPYTVVNVLLNAIPIYIGFRFIGKKFTFFSCIYILLSGFLTDLLPTHVITYDTLLISIFGGLINGFAISLCLQVDATTGGTDFIAIFLSERKGMDSWNIIFGLNVCILCLAGILFGWDKALYSIIFQFVSTQVLQLRYQQYQKETFFVVTNQGQEICDAIHRETHHGATLMSGTGAYEKCERDLVYSVVSRPDRKKVIRAVRQIDPKAFINILKTEELQGWFYRIPKE